MICMLPCGSPVPSIPRSDSPVLHIDYYRIYQYIYIIYIMYIYAQIRPTSREVQVCCGAGRLFFHALRIYYVPGMTFVTLIRGHRAGKSSPPAPYYSRASLPFFSREETSAFSSHVDFPVSPNRANTPCYYSNVPGLLLCWAMLIK